MQSSACQSLKLLRIDCHFFCGPHAVDTRLCSYASCLHESLHLHQSCACLKPAQNTSSADLTVDKLVYRLHSCTQAAYEWHICRKLSAAASIVQAMLARMRRNTCIPVTSLVKHRRSTCCLHLHTDAASHLTNFPLHHHDFLTTPRATSITTTKNFPVHHHDILTAPRSFYQSTQRKLTPTFDSYLRLLLLL